MKKKIFIISGIIVVCLALAGYLGYRKFFMPDPKVQSELEQQFGPGFFTSFTPDTAAAKSGTAKTQQGGSSVAGASASGTGTGTNKSSGQEVQQVSAQSGAQAGSQSAASAAGSAVTAAPEQSASSGQTVTVQTIENEYMPKFQSLQSVALGRLDTLYAAAVQEYHARKQAGTLNGADFVQKYMQAGNMLQSNMDGQFNSLLNSMQQDLVAHNLPTGIVGQIRSEYNSAKAAKRSQLMSKVGH